MMSLLRKTAGFWIAISLLAGCSGASQPPSAVTPSPSLASASLATETPQAATSQPTATTSPTAEAPRRSKYTLDATLDYARHHLAVDERIAYINSSSETLTELVLMVEPLYYPGTFQLDRLEWGEGEQVEGVITETGWLRFGLKQPLAPGEKVNLSLSYQLNLPSPTPSAAIRPIPFGYTERQANLVDWYPFVPPFIPGKGWLAHPAGFYGEHLVFESVDFSVNLRLAENQPEIVIAASASAQRDGEWLRFEHRQARNFAFSASPDYQVLTAQAGAVQVTSYAFNGQEAANQAVLDTTVKSLELYSRLFGAYPHSSLAVVEADFLDGMEYDGMYFLSKGFYNLYTGTPAEYLIAIAAHETAHQWWYAQVGNDQALEPWLDEALCTYSERLFFETYYPEALNWWWAYRVNYYQPRGRVDDSIYNPRGEAEPYRAYRDAVYLNGAVFLEELRTLVGDETFLQFLSIYAERYSGQIATREAFFTVLRELLSSNQQAELDGLVKKYFSIVE
ncbi:MAG: M1 family metallopeptidase [Anaerolineales bacterium]|jgi:hypothetical protein|nr:M1 family metallopeptidase [Anaerolineales bacterium]